MRPCSLSSRRLPVPATAGLVVGVAAALLVIGQTPANAAQPPVALGTATSFGVLAGSTVTNTGPSVITGNVGVSPGTAITGFPPAVIHSGAKHSADGVAAQAQLDLTTAYDDAAGRTPVTSVGADLTGRTLLAGIYGNPTLGLTGTLTLDAKHDPNAVFVFQAASTLKTKSSSRVALLNGANPCNVYWKVGSSATLGTHSTFVGNVLALTSITAATGASIYGRLLARNGAVTLDSNLITGRNCARTPPQLPAPTTSPPASGSSTPTGTGPSSGPGVPFRTTASPTTPGRTSSGPSTSPAGQPPHLARTGADTGGLALGGALAIALGTIVLLLARRGIAWPKRRH